MIRFRLGQNWKRELVPEQGPLDAFGLVLDGVDLLAGASEEPLAQLVPALVETVHALAHGRERCGQLSLHEAQLELCLWRTGAHEVELSVVSLGRPAKLQRSALVLELAELGAAAARCARGLARDLAESAPALLTGKKHKAMERQARALEAGGITQLPELDPGQWGYERFASQEVPGLILSDPDGRLLAYSKRSAANLPPLLVSGRLVAAGAPAAGPVFLTMLELTRQAAGEAPSARLPLGTGTVSPQVVFELGLELCFALRTRNPALSKNPFVESLAERCGQGLAALKVVARPQGPAPKKAHRRRPTGPPLDGPGALRRLRFEPKWEKSTPGGDATGQLRLGSFGPVVATNHSAIAFTPAGELLYRRLDTHGVSATADGRVLTSDGNRVMFFVDREASARWVRDHDGLAIDSTLQRVDGLLVTGLAGRGAVAFDELTGRERWRLDPPRSQHGAWAVQGHRVLLATDTGSLYGLDVADGQVRFRVRASLPMPFATVPMGKRALALLSGADRTALFAIDLHTGNLSWSCEMTLEKPSRPVVAFGRLFVAGRRDGKAVVLGYDSKGTARFERQVPLHADRLALVTVGKGVVAQDGRGAAALVGADGQLEWVLGGDGADLHQLVAPVVSRGVVLVAGRVVRAVDPKTGRVLAELEAGTGLADLKADRRLNLYLLDEIGALKAYALTSHLAVV